MAPAVAPEEVEYRPALQRAQLVAEAKPTPVKKEPAAQFKQVFADVAAEAVEYKPAQQGMQAEEAEAPVPVE